MCRIKIQDLLPERISVFLCACFCLCEFLEIFKIICVQFMSLAVVQERTGIFRSTFQDSIECIAFIQKFFEIVVYRRCITTLFFITEQKNCIFRINSRIGNALHTGVDLLLCQLTVADDHLAHLWIIAVKTAGKQFFCDFFRIFSTHWFQKEFLIQNCIILIDLAILHLAFCKTFHGVFVAFVGLRVSVLISDHAGIDIRLACISQRIVIIGKIHQKLLWKLSPIGNVHCFHIIFVKSCDAQASLNSKRKPAEILRFARISLHHIFADRFQYIIGRKSVISCGQRLIKTAVEFFLIAGQVCQAHHQFLGKEASPAGIVEYLHPERRKSVQVGNIPADPVPCFQVKNRAGTSLLIQFLHHKKCHGRRILISRIHLQKNPEKLETVRLLPEKVLNLLERLPLVSVKPYQGTQIQIGSCFLQFIPCKFLALAVFENFLCKTLVVLKISKICLKQTVLRIFISGFMKSFQNSVRFLRPGLEVGFFFAVINIGMNQSCLAAFLFCIQINADTRTPGCCHMINKLLIRAFYDDLSELISFFEFFCVYYIIDAAAASDEFILSDHMTLRLQEIYGRFDLQTEISPPCLVNIKRFLYGFSESEKVCCCCFERNRDRIFFSETDQKFLQVLIVGGCRRKACIQCLLFLVCLCHDCCKRRFLKQMIGCFEILCSGLFECFDVLYFFEKVLFFVLSGFNREWNLVFSYA